MFWLAVIIVFCVQLKYSNKDWTWTKNQCNSAYKRWTQGHGDGEAYSKEHVLRFSSSFVSDTAQETWTLMVWPAAWHHSTGRGETIWKVQYEAKSQSFWRGGFHCISSGISKTPLRNVSGFYGNWLKLRTFNPSYWDHRRKYGQK